MDRKLIAGIRLEKEQFKAYALGMFFSLLSFPLYMAVYYFLWLSVSRASASLPMALNQLMVYYGTVFFIKRLIPGRSFSEEMSRSIRKGRINRELILPMDLQRQIIYEEVSHSLIYVLILLPTLVATILLFGKGLPLNVLSFTLLLVPAFFVSFFVYSVLWEVAFWTEKIKGLLWAFNLIIRLLSGSLIPLAFFPSWFQGMSGFMPFEFMAGLPARALLGGIGLQQALVFFAVGMAWAGLLCLVTRLMISRGLKRYSGYGV